MVCKNGDPNGKKPFVLIFFLLGFAVLFVCFGDFKVPKPSDRREVANPEFISDLPAFDVWGKEITEGRAEQLMKSPEGKSFLSPSHGAVQIDQQTLDLGRQVFYEETFGNEVYFTDILGILDGPITARQIAKAITALEGKGTTNLRVELASTVKIAGQILERGTFVDTGLDVPAGGLAPLGMTFRAQNGKIRVGITCAACHSTVDPKTFKIIQGAPNTDLRSGLLIALAPNSASYLIHANIQNLSSYVKDRSRTIQSSRGNRLSLPDPKLLEDAVDAVFLKWPPGYFDSMVDFRADPTQIPTCFTHDAYPYGWSGFASIGPFQGLSSLNNNVHGLNSDPFTITETIPKLFGIDKELYIATLLQNAAAEKDRFDPATNQKPSKFLANIVPNSQIPSLNETVPLPSFPNGSLISPTGLLTGSPGHKIWEQINALSAWQNTLIPPPAPIVPDLEKQNLGRQVFEKAHCVSCHSGPTLTNHQVLAVDQIQTEPLRARAFAPMEGTFAEPTLYAFDQHIPLPKNPRIIKVPTEDVKSDQIHLSFAWGGSSGGYKVPSLIGLYWSAPYLHDGGVAAGSNPQEQLGVPGTLLSQTPPDPVQSLRALVDRDLRKKVIAANLANSNLRMMRVKGIGHEFWVDASAGFNEREQDALIFYLLTYQDPRTTERQRK